MPTYKLTFTKVETTIRTAEKIVTSAITDPEKIRVWAEVAFDPSAGYDVRANSTIAYYTGGIPIVEKEAVTLSVELVPDVEVIEAAPPSAPEAA